VLPVNPIGADSSSDVRERVQKFVNTILGKKDERYHFYNDALEAVGDDRYLGILTSDDDHEGAPQSCKRCVGRHICLVEIALYEDV